MITMTYVLLEGSYPPIRLGSTTCQRKGEQQGLEYKEIQAKRSELRQIRKNGTKKRIQK